MRDVTAFVLAGGKSSRMGRDKAFLEISGQTLLSRALSLAGAVCSDVQIAGDIERFVSFGAVVEDEFKGQGPLAAIHAALKSSASELNLILAVDLPFVEARFLEYLISSAQTGSALVTVPRAEGRWQPLCAVYRQRFWCIAEEALAKGKNKIDALFAGVEVQMVDDLELKSNGFTTQMFQNLNTPAEWEAATLAFKTEESQIAAANAQAISSKILNREGR